MIVGYCTVCLHLAHDCRWLRISSELQSRGSLTGCIHLSVVTWRQKILHTSRMCPQNHLAPYKILRALPLSVPMATLQRSAAPLSSVYLCETTTHSTLRVGVLYVRRSYRHMSGHATLEAFAQVHYRGQVANNRREPCRSAHRPSHGLRPVASERWLC